jgi:hypothetical protein
MQLLFLKLVQASQDQITSYYDKFSTAFRAFPERHAAFTFYAFLCIQKGGLAGRCSIGDRSIFPPAAFTKKCKAELLVAGRPWTPNREN